MRHKILICILIALVLAGAAAAQEEPGVTYIVREGNTLEQIAEFFDVSLDCLTEGNALDAGEDPETGTALVIANDCPPYEADEAPSEGQGGGGTATTQQAPSGQGGGGSRVAVNGVYVVQRGDKLSLIARDNGVSLICLVVANQIFNPDLIYVGQRITVPDDCARYEQGGGLPGTPAPAPGGGRVYTVQTQLGVKTYVLQPDGSYIVRVTDTLDFIALGFNVDTRCLAASNQIVNTYRIQPGQRLVINFNCPPWSGEPGPRSPLQGGGMFGGLDNGPVG